MRGPHAKWTVGRHSVAMHEHVHVGWMPLGYRLTDMNPLRALPFGLDQIVANTLPACLAKSTIPICWNL